MAITGFQVNPRMVKRDGCLARVASKSVGKRPTAALPACAEKLRSREFFSKQSQDVIENKGCSLEGPRIFNKTKVLS